MNDDDRHFLYEFRAKQDFEAAMRKGFWHSIWSWFTQRDNKLLPFDEIRKSLPVGGQHDAGMQQIPLEKIVGSVGRYQDFDRAFLPRHRFLSTRWVNIDRAHLQDIILPPIEVYKIGEIYFVKDGNHRVSVARERGQVFIDALVTVIDVPFPVTADSNVDDLIRKAESAGFLAKTHLDELRPQAAIELTLPGGYDKLVEHVGVHRWFMGERRQSPVPYEEAVASWYDEVYLPMVQVIHEQKILDLFPGRTEADLYLWIIEHLWYLREEYQDEISLEEAARHFSEGFSPLPFRWLMDMVRTGIGYLGGMDARAPESEDGDD